VADAEQSRKTRLMKCPVTVDRLRQLISGENRSYAVCAPGDE
jgi:hypothetical protein